ncbi:MAG: carbohydrate ABC transporter permease [Mycobacteriales bacterium]
MAVERPVRTRQASAAAPAATGDDRQQPSRRRRGLSFEAKIMAPGLLLLAALSIVPFVTIVWMSFSRVRLLGGVHFSWTGLTNWTRVFTDADVRSSWLLSAFYFVATVGLEMVLGLAIALLVHRLMRGRNLVLSLLLLPMFVAPIIVGLLGRFLTDSTFGLYAWALRGLGVSGDLLGTKNRALAAVILMDVWEWTPLIVIIALAGLAAVPKAVLEAAAVDGANYWHTLRRIVLPTISGVLLVALLIRAMDAIRFFDIISVTTNGGPANGTKIIPIRLYETAFRFFDLGYAAAIGLGMLVFSILVANIFVASLQRKGLAK